ncbi:MAG: peptidylprolyl isomerase [Sphingomonadales bacterium]|nr:peptidylprolyl isomerase [Sphingomonadales bacterium]
MAFSKLLAPLVALLLLPLPAFAQASAPPAAEAANDLPIVTLDTGLGPIVIALDTVHAPVTAANFLRYVEEKRLDGTGFYRAMTIADGLGLIQGGTRNDPRRTLPGIAHEATSETGLRHTDGTISMARGAPGTASGDFFILIGDMPSLDAVEGEGDTAGFAAFGRVIEGMDVVRAIAARPTSPTLGEGVMRGQMLDPVVAIRAARVTDRPAP